MNTTFQAPAAMNEEYIYFPMTVYGYDTDFAQDSEWPFELRMEGLETDREVWTAVRDNSSLIILDGTFSPNIQMGGGGPDDGNHGVSSPSDIAKIGEDVTFRGPNGETVTKTVAGILKQFFINGVFMGKEGAAQSFNITFPAIYMFDLVEDDKADEMAKIIERELGLDTVVLTTIVKQITDMMEQFFNLFSAFMGLGLVVGIAGLGIITLRAVHERRMEIGMMRAIGFKRRSVTFSFLMESSFIALVGILLGSLLGILVGFNIWYDGFRSIDFEFYIPWTRIIVVGIIAYVATAIFTIPPAYMASKVTPAEALRFD
jgi:putative ABC transport system permease protein